MPKILFADDSLSVRKVAERLLTAAGHEVELVTSAEEALAWLVNGQPDLVIADVIMPDKSGFDVCAYIRSQTTLSHTPVLLVSGVVDAEVTRQAEACRANGVIKKPFQGTSLQEHVLALLASAQEQPAPLQRGPVRPLEWAPMPPDPALAPAEPDTRFQREGEVPAETAAGGGLAGPKVFRITEEQLQTVRQAAARAKEAETRLAEEQKRVAHLEEQMQALREGSGQPAAPMREFEARLADEQKRAAYLEGQVQALREAGAQAAAQVREFEARLADEYKEAAHLTARIQGLEARLAEEEQRSVQLMKHVAEKEHAAACAERLAQALADIARLVNDRPGES